MHSRYKFTLGLVVGCCCLLFGTTAFAKTASDLDEDIFNMSLEELMDIDVSTGSMLPVSARKSQSAITIISRNEIQNSPARNIAALLETYVPGLIVMTHSEGDKIGLRGMIAAENYKLILLLNGHNISNFVYEGIITEIDMWDLDDIERIEVVRGPGSVTYGTGAIAGVVNIITREADSEYTRFSTAGDAVFRSFGGNATVSTSLSDDWSLLAFASVRRSLGQEDPLYRVSNGDTTSDERIIGAGAESTVPQDYLADGLDKPQIKAHVHLTNHDNLSLTARFTQSGQTHNTRAKMNITDGDGNVIEQVNDRHVALRSFSVFPTLNFDHSETFRSAIKLGFDSQEYLRYDGNVNSSELEQIGNIRDYAFSQDRWVARAEVFYSIDNLNINAGVEYNRIQVGSPWFADADEVLIREGVYMVSDTNTSVYWNNPISTVSENRGAFEIGDGFGVGTISFLAQGEIKLHEQTTVFAGFRVDKPDIANVQFSPRVTLFHTLDENNSLRLTWQTSQRLMPLRAQYLFYERDRTSDDELRNEEIMTTELSWKTLLSEHVSIETHAFLNDIDIVGFTGTDLQFIGNQFDAGLEIETVYKNDALHIRFNHAMHFPLDFEANDELRDSTNRNNITFSDYLYRPRTKYPILLQSTGSNLNNWSNHTSKLIVRQGLLNNNLQVHVDARVFWEFQGSLDEVIMYRNAYNAVDISELTSEELKAFEEDRNSFENEAKLLEESGAYKATFTVNAAVSYGLDLNEGQRLTFTLFGERLLGDAFRYYVSTGSANHYPERLRWIEEPTTIGLRASLLLK